MKEIYLIHNIIDPDTYVVERTRYPCFIAYIKKKEIFEVTKLRLIDNCEASVLAKALTELESFIFNNLDHNKMKRSKGSGA